MKEYIFSTKAEARTAHNAWIVGLKTEGTLFLEPHDIPKMLEYCKQHALGLSVTNTEKGLLPIWLYKK